MLLIFSLQYKSQYMNKLIVIRITFPCILRGFLEHLWNLCLSGKRLCGNNSAENCLKNNHGLKCHRAIPPQMLLDLWVPPACCVLLKIVCLEYHTAPKIQNKDNALEKLDLTVVASTWQSWTCCVGSTCSMHRTCALPILNLWGTANFTCVIGMGKVHEIRWHLLQWSFQNFF